MAQSVIELGTGNIRTAEDQEGDVFAGHIDMIFADEVEMFYDLYVWDEEAEFPRWLYVGPFATYDEAEERGLLFGEENMRITEGSWYTRD